jgi:hypothetical protein
MQHYIGNLLANYKIFVGETTYTGDYTNGNTLCYTGPDDGLAECIATGRYIIFEYQGPTGGDAEFSEIMAFAEKNVGNIAHGDTVSTSGITITDGSADRLHGPSDSSVECVDGTVDTKSFTATLTYNKSVEVSHVAVITAQTSSNIDTVQIDTEVDGVTTPCGSITINSTKLRNSITCAAPVMAKTITWTFATSYTSLRNLCKLAVFGKYCYDLPYTITEDPFS